MNAIVTCRLCVRTFDKGCPADPTQDDTSFVCSACAVTLGGYPQNGYVNPLVLRPDTRNETEVKPSSPFARMLRSFWRR